MSPVLDLCSIIYDRPALHPCLLERTARNSILAVSVSNKRLGIDMHEWSSRNQELDLGSPIFWSKSNINTTDARIQYSPIHQQSFLLQSNWSWKITASLLLYLVNSLYLYPPNKEESPLIQWRSTLEPSNIFTLSNLNLGRGNSSHRYLLPKTLSRTRIPKLRKWSYWMDCSWGKCIRFYLGGLGEDVVGWSFLKGWQTSPMGFSKGRRRWVGPLKLS